MAKHPKIRPCDNCGYRTEDVRNRGDKRLCRVCAESMPGIYCVGSGSKVEHSDVATTMRQQAYCTNLILDELKKMSMGAQRESQPKDRKHTQDLPKVRHLRST